MSKIMKPGKETRGASALQIVISYCNTDSDPCTASVIILPSYPNELPMLETVIINSYTINNDSLGKWLGN